MQRVKISLMCLLSLSLAGVLVAQTAVDPSEDVGSASLQDFSGGATLRGTYFDVRNMTGDGVGYRHGYTQIGAFTPFWLNEDAFIAPNGRLIVTDNSRIGANLGLVGRRYSSSRDRIFGINGYVDTDETLYGNRYQQATVGVETLGTFWDFRANGYFALGTTDRFLKEICVGGDPYFVGNQIAFLGQQLREESLSGGDFEFGVPVNPSTPWLRAYAGAYGYQSNASKEPIGVRARLEAWISDDLSVGVNVTDDRQFGTNINAVVDFRFSGFKPTRYFPQWTTQERMLMPVQRNWRVSTDTYVQNVDIAAINPDTDAPYFVAHIDNSAGGPPSGDGSFENPFNYLPGSAPGADLILVAAGTTSEVAPLVGSITLEDNQRMLGEGKAHMAAMFAEYGDCIVDGTYVLPGFTNSGKYPFLSSTGNIITLGNNNEVAAFNLVNAFGAAITNGPGGSNDFLLQCLEISGNAGNNGNVAGGISLTDATGTGIMRGINLNSGSTNHLNPDRLGNNGNNSSSGGIFVDTGAAGLNLTLTDVAMNSYPNNQAFGIFLLADDGPLTTTFTNVEANGIAPGFGNSTAGIILAESGQNLTATLTNVSASNNTGAGVQVLGTGGSINLTSNSLTATGNGGDNLQIGSASLLLPPVYPGPLVGTNFTGNISNSFFDGSTLGSGIVFSQDGGQGVLTLTNVSAQNNFVDGMGLFGTNATAMVATVNDSFMNNNGRDGFHVEETAGAVIDLTVDPTDVRFNGRDGLFFNLADSTLNVTFLSNLVDNNNRSSIHGEMDASNLNLLFDQSTGNLSGSHGLFLSAVNGSNASLTITGGTFADSGRLLPGSDGVHIESDASFITLVMTDTPANNTLAPPAGTQRHGLFLDIQNFSTFDGTVTGGDFTNSLDHGLNATFGDSLATLTLDNTSLSNSGADGMHVTVTGASTDATISLLNGSLNDNSGEDGLDFHVNEGHLTVNAIGSSFTNSGAGGVNGSGILGLIGDLAPGGLVNLNFTNTPVTNSLDNGMFVTAIDSNIQAVFDSSPLDDNGVTTGGDGVRLDLSNSTFSSLSLINGSNVNRNGGNGIELNATNGTIFTGDFADVSISDNGQTAQPGNDNGVVANVDLAGAGGSTVNLTFNTVAIGNNAPNATQQVGFLFDVENSGTLTADFTGSDLSNNSQNALNGFVTTAGTATVNLVGTTADNSGEAGLIGTVDGLASTLNLSLDGSTIDNSATFGALLNAMAGGVLNFDGINSSSISSSGSAGVFVTSTGAFSEANLGFDTMAINDNGLDNGGEGFNGAALLGGTLNVCLDNSTVTGNANQGLEVLVTGTNSLANFGVETSFIDDNGSEGLLVDVSDEGVLNYRSQNSSYSGNGLNGTLDGVNVTVTGTGAADTVTTARFLFSGDTVDANTDDGFEFNAAMGATLVVSLDNTSASDNVAGYGLQFNPNDAGTKAYLLMSGNNQFNNNGAGPININGGVITGIDTAVISLSGSFDNADGDGIHLELIDVANAIVAIQGPGTINNSLDNGGAGAGDNGDGIDIRMTNNTLATMTGSILINGFNNIDDSAADGIHIEMTNTNLLNTFNGALEISNIGSITNSGGDAIDVSLIGMTMLNGLTIPVAPVEILTLADSVDLTTPLATPLNACLPLPVTLDLNASGLIPANALTIDGVAADNSQGRGINVLALNSEFDDNGIAITSNGVANSQAGDGLHLDFDTVTGIGGGTLTGVLIDGNGAQSNSGNGFNFDFVDSPIEDLMITNNGAGSAFVSGTLDFSFDNLIWTTFMDNNSTAGLDIAQVQLDIAPSGQFWRPDQTPFVTVGFEPTPPTDVTVGLDSVNGVQIIPGNYPVEDTLGNVLPFGGVPVNSQVLTLGFIDFNPGEQLTYSLSHTDAGGNSGNGGSFTGSTGIVTLADGRTASGVFTAAGLQITQVFAAVVPGISTNDLDGIRFSLNNSSLTNLVMDANQIESNGVSGAGHGVNFQSVINSDISNATVSNNTIDDNAGDGFRLVNPNTAGAPIDLLFQDNDITNNRVGVAGSGNGINLQLNNTEVANVTIESLVDGNNISGNDALGVNIRAVGDSQLILAVGGAGNANLLDGNVDAGLGIDLGNTTVNSITVENTTFSDTTNGGNALFNGGGMEVRLTGTTQVAPFTIGHATDNNVSFEGNAGSGFSLLLNDTSTVNNLLIQNITSEGNDLHQVRVDRRGASVVNVTMNDSTLTGHATSLDGFSYNATNDTAVTPLLVNLNNNVIGTNRDGVAIDTSANVEVVANIIENTIENNRDNGIRVTTLNASSFGNPNDGTASAFLGNTITGNGNGDGDAGIRLNALDTSFQNVLIGESAGGTRTTLANNRDGIRISDTSTANPFSTPDNNYQIQATDIIDSGNDGIRLDLTGVGTRVYIGDPLAAASATRDDVVITRTVPTAGGTGHGVNVNSTTSGTNNVSIRNATIEYSGLSGVNIAQSGGDLTFNMQATDVLFSGQRGLFVNVTGATGTTGNDYNVGGTGANEGVLIQNSGMQGILFRTQSPISSSALITLPTNNYGGGAQIDPLSANVIIARLNLVNSQVVSNGTVVNNVSDPNSDGIVLAIGTNTRQDVLIAGSTIDGNVLDDLRIFPFVSLNTQNDSVNNATQANNALPPLDTLRLDPIARLNLVFGSTQPAYDSTTLPAVANPQLTPLIPQGMFPSQTPSGIVLATRNTGNQINVTEAGNAGTNAIAASNGTFTTAGAFTAVGRGATLDGQVQISDFPAPGDRLSNTASLVDSLNQFIQQNVEQDLDATFFGNGFTLNPANVFP